MSGKNPYKDMEYQDYLETLHWEKTREKKLSEADRKCETCGRNSALEVHHLTYERIGGELSSDLRVLCAPCHRLAHGREVTSDDYERVRFVNGSETMMLHNMIMQERGNR